MNEEETDSASGTEDEDLAHVSQLSPEDSDDQSEASINSIDQSEDSDDEDVLTDSDYEWTPPTPPPESTFMNQT